MGKICMFSPKTGIRFLTLDQTEKFLTERLPVTNLSQAASTIQLTTRNMHCYKSSSSKLKTNVSVKNIYISSLLGRKKWFYLRDLFR